MALHVNPGAVNQSALFACRDRFGGSPVASIPAISYLNKDQAVVVLHDKVNFTAPAAVITCEQA
jgi:hypothetical protein